MAAMRVCAFLLLCGFALAENRYLLDVGGGPALAPATAALAPVGIGLPGMQAAAQSAPFSNMVATVIANSANFTDEYTLVLEGVAPVIAYFADTPEWRAGTWNLTQFTNPKMAAEGFWLGGPDATLIGTTATGSKVSVILGTLDGPMYDAETMTLQLNATVLNASDPLSMKGGIANYMSAGKGATVLTTAPTSLTNVALILDLAVGKSAPVAETKGATASFRFGDSGDEGSSGDGAEDVQGAPQAQIRSNARSNVRGNIRSNVRSSIRSNTAEGP